MADTSSSSNQSQKAQDAEAVKAADFQATEDAAEKAAPSSVTEVNPGNNLNPVVEKGADKDFNAWVRAAHTSGNPEQFSPMQAAQNIRDAVAGQTATGTNRIDDTSDEDTRWVVENVKGEKVQE